MSALSAVTGKPFLFTPNEATFNYPPRRSLTSNVIGTLLFPAKAAGALVRPFDGPVYAGLINRVEATSNSVADILDAPAAPYKVKLGFGTQTVNLPNKSLAVGMQSAMGVVEAPLAMAAPYALVPLDVLYGAGKTAQKLIAPDSLTADEAPHIDTFLSSQVNQWQLPTAAHVPLSVIAGTLDVGIAAIRPVTRPVEQGFENLYKLIQHNVTSWAQVGTSEPGQWNRSLDKPWSGPTSN